MKKTVCCLFGGESTEYEVSLSSASSVLENIDRERYDVIMMGITREGRWYLFEGDQQKVKDGSWYKDEENLTPAYICPSKGVRAILTQDGRRIHIDLVFPVMHGAHSEDGTLQGLLELSGIPFVGPHCTASAVCMDKSVTKAVLNSYQIPQAKAVILSKNDLERDFVRCADEVAKLGYPVFVKPASAGSSVGVSKVKVPEELKAALEKALQSGGKVLVEEFIEGREIEVAVMGNEDPQASCPGEIDPGSEFYDYETKYLADTASYYIPARLDEAKTEEVRALALRIYRALGCVGLSRVDFFCTKEGKFIFNEINTLPGFTSISMYPKLFMQIGMSYSEIITSLLELAERA
jgi:D-alanine-D-alanine ligase